MSYEERLETISVPANADLSAKQYCFVKVNSSGRLVAAGDGELALGILQDKPAAAGRAGCVATGGVSKCLLGGTVTAGDRVSSNSDGAGVSEGTGDNITMGIAMESGASGEIIAVNLQPTAQTV